MTKPIAIEAIEWFCDICQTSSIVIRKSHFDAHLPLDWIAVETKTKWYQLNKWTLYCSKCKEIQKVK